MILSKNASKEALPQSIKHPLIDNSSLFLCHEIRTPLTAIQGALRLLHQHHLDTRSSQGQRVLKIAIDNVSRLIRLANALEESPNVPATIFSDSLVEQLQIENDLHSAIARREIYVAYQPIFSSEQNTILGFEALARWQHPQRGNVPPELFIGLAEKTGYIHELGLCVMEQACHQLYRWQQKFPSLQPLTISVNISTMQLLEANLVQSVREILARTGVLPNTLKLEITESALIENKDVASSSLISLRSLGIEFYVDDFGTGYSSLGRLKEFPIDVLKIDRSFVMSKQWDISEMIVWLAEKLGLSVIAEGVETADDVAALESVGCRMMQGHFFASALDIQSATALLEQSYRCHFASS